MPATRVIAPAIKPGGREAAASRYGSGNVNRNTDMGTAKREKIGCTTVNILKKKGKVIKCPGQEDELPSHI